MKTKEELELEYLRWFVIECDFGPAHEDIVMDMNDNYTKETGNKVPKGWEEA